MDITLFEEIRFLISIIIPVGIAIYGFDEWKKKLIKEKQFNLALDFLNYLNDLHNNIDTIRSQNNFFFRKQLFWNNLKTNDEYIKKETQRLNRKVNEASMFALFYRERYDEISEIKNTLDRRYNASKFIMKDDFNSKLKDLSSAIGTLNREYENIWGKAFSNSAVSEKYLEDHFDEDLNNPILFSFNGYSPNDFDKRLQDVFDAVEKSLIKYVKLE
jgi:hypothetical protein